MATLMAGAVAAVKAASFSTILQAVGTGVSAVGSLKAGADAKAASEFNAAQLDASAKAESAASQRKAEEERRQKRLVQSRARAVGAASGGGIDLELAGDLEEEGEYRALTALWEGEEAAKGRRNQAAATRFEGRQSKKAGFLKAGRTILGGGGSLYEKYS